MFQELEGMSDGPCRLLRHRVQALSNVLKAQPRRLFALTLGTLTLQRGGEL
jgi:hypothetical protein